MTRIRILWQAFFLSLFVFLCLFTCFDLIGGYPVRLFLDADPLAALATLLSTWRLERWLVLSLSVILATLVFGRAFCDWVCPFGILNHLFGTFLNRRGVKERIESNRFRPVYRLKYYLLAGFLAAAAFGAMQTGLMDPIALLWRSFANGVLPVARDAIGPAPSVGIPASPLHAHGGWVILSIFVAILLLNRVVPRFWCRALCPLGALLGLVGKWSLWKIRRDPSTCTACGLCAADCEGACDPNEKLRASECVMCLNCRDACPHGSITYAWLPSVDGERKSPDLDRRRVLGGLFLGALAAPAIGALQRVALSKDRVIRPPGSLAESEFLDRCIKCGACMKVCPTNVLQPALHEAGLAGLWTPIQVSRQVPEGVSGVGFCQSDCVLCGQVCPTKAIQPLTVEQRKGRADAPYDRPVKVGTAFYDLGRCLPHAMGITCLVCEEVCPVSPKAIQTRLEKRAVSRVDPKTGQKTEEIVELQLPYIVPDRCIGCGSCESACPITDLPAVRVSSFGESRERQYRTGFLKRT